MMEDKVHPCATSRQRAPRQCEISIRHTDMRRNWGPHELDKENHGTGKHELQRNSTVHILTSAAEGVVVPQEEKNELQSQQEEQTNTENKTKEAVEP
jgi:hypothetical protein